MGDSTVHKYVDGGAHKVIIGIKLHSDISEAAPEFLEGGGLSK